MACVLLAVAGLHRAGLAEAPAKRPLAPGKADGAAWRERDRVRSDHRARIGCDSGGVAICPRLR